MKRTIDVAAYTDRGSSAAKNQDRIMIGEKVYKEGTHTDTRTMPYVMAVCDGVGGYDGGDEAAECVLSELSLVKPSLMNSRPGIDGALKRANERLRLMREQKKIKQNEMLTTVAGIVLSEDNVLIFHAGDSRVYRMRGGYLTRFTKDHSEVQELLNQGVVVENPEAALAKGSTITRTMGDGQSRPPAVKEMLIPPRNNDLYMVCSDGVWSALSIDQMEDILSENLPLNVLAVKLCEAARAAGSKDDVSVCLGRVEEKELPMERSEAEME